MTVKKAIKILDYVIQRKSQIKEGFLDPKMSWNKGSDFVRSLSDQLAITTQNDIDLLNSIKSELVTNCKHPKNMKDKADGVWYCMNCNADL